GPGSRKGRNTEIAVVCSEYDWGCRSRGQIGRATPAQQSHELRHADRHTRAMNMTSKKPLHTVPVPSTSFTTEAYFDGQGSSPAIRFGYRSEERRVGKECRSQWWRYHVKKK